MFTKYKDTVLLKKLMQHGFQKLRKFCFDLISVYVTGFQIQIWFNLVVLTTASKVVEKGTATDDLSDMHVHFISAGDKFFTGFYLNMVRYRHVSKKKLQVLPTDTAVDPDEVFDTYTVISVDLHINVESLKLLIQKANSYM